MEDLDSIHLHHHQQTIDIVLVLDLIHQHQLYLLLVQQLLLEHQIHHFPNQIQLQYQLDQHHLLHRHIWKEILDHYHHHVPELVKMVVYFQIPLILVHYNHHLRHQIHLGDQHHLMGEDYFLILLHHRHLSSHRSQD